jgi:hypothetical protein
VLKSPAAHLIEPLTIAITPDGRVTVDQVGQLLVSRTEEQENVA